MRTFINHLSFFSLLIAMLFSANKASAYGCSSGYVYFGTPQSNHGACVGRGVCEESGGINVSFKVAADNPDVLVMIFSLAELKLSQPEQAEYFASSASYMFDNAYSLSGSLFAGLDLPANSWILPTSNSVVEISGDQVISYITISHVAY